MCKVPSDTHAEKVLLHHIDYTSARIAELDSRSDANDILWMLTLLPGLSFGAAVLISRGALVLLAAIGAGRFLGLGAYWEKLDIVRRFPILK